MGGLGVSVRLLVSYKCTHTAFVPIACRVAVQSCSTYIYYALINFVILYL